MEIRGLYVTQLHATKIMKGELQMFKRIKVPLTPEQNRVLSIMRAIAHQKVGQTYSTADLLKLINHQLNSNERRRVGRCFAAYAKENGYAFEIIRSSSNHKYYTKP